MNVGTTKKPIGLLCNSSSWGGLEMNVLSLAQRMSERGWPMIIYGRSDSILAEQAQANGMCFSHLSSHFKFGDVINAGRLARLTANDGVSVLINNINQDIFLSVLAKRFSKKPLCLLYCQNMQLGVDKRDRFHTWLYGNLDGWIAPLSGFIGSLKTRTNMNTEKVHVIPFGIEVERFNSDLPTRQQARQTLDLPQDATIVGVIGRLDSKKGQHTLIEALAILKEKYSSLHALILGDKTHGEAESYERHLHQLSETLNLEDRIHFRPHRADVETAFSALDVFAMTSESETYGMVTLEAMAAGVPVIGTNAGGTKELIENGMDGLLYTYDKPAELANFLRRILADGDFGETLRKNARSKVDRNFSSRRQCELLEELIEKLTTD